MDQRRISPRFRVMKGAKILFNGEASVIDCTVRDQSATGVRLKVVSPVGIPPAFTLMFASDGSRRPCRVVWVREREIGAVFAD